MSILKAEILESVNNATERSETNIDTILLQVLLDISHRGSFIKSSVTGTLSGNVTTITKPDNCVEVDYITLQSLTVTEPDTILYQITFAEYLENIEPGFAKRGDTIYIRPKSSTDRTYVLYYGKKHAEDVDTIEFGEDFRKAIELGCKMETMRQYERLQESEYYETLYEKEIQKLVDALDDGVPPVVKARAIQ